MIVLKHRRSTARSIWLYSLLLVLTAGRLPTGAQATSVRDSQQSQDQNAIIRDNQQPQNQNASIHDSQQMKDQDAIVKEVLKEHFQSISGSITVPFNGRETYLKIMGTESYISVFCGNKKTYKNSCKDEDGFINAFLQRLWPLRRCTISSGGTHSLEKTPASYDVRRAEWWAELDKKKIFNGPDTQELLALWLDVPILERQIIFPDGEIISYTFTKQDLIGLYNDIHYQTTLDTAKQR